MSVDAIGKRIELGVTATVVPLYAILLLVISKLLINAFSFTERLRANLLEAQIALNKQAQETLRKSEERYRLLADNARDVIWTMELDGGISYVSPAVEKVRGYTPAEAMRQSLNEILTPDSQAIVVEYFNKLQATVRAGRPPENFRGELEYWCKDGSTFWTEVIAVPLLGSDGAFVEILGMTRDISERKRYEHELQQARDAAEAANRAKSEFLAHMSHEIRTPLNVVLGLAQVLNREPLTANQSDMIGRIQSAGQSLFAILNDILDLSKIEAGQLRLDPHPFALATLLTRLQRLMAPTAQARGLKLTVSAPPVSLGGLHGDVLRLEQVLVNLVGNALKFSERGEVAVQVEVCEAGESAVRLRFAVRDTGIGIAPEVLARLFTPFTQADSGITRQFGGTGLGLVICKRLVELMDGVIGVESQVGQGSTFWFELPLARTTEGALETLPALAPAPGLPTGPRLAGVRVLVVDDSAMNRDVVERALGLEGAIATLAADGQQAVQLLRARPEAFDAVLMDVRMPVMDGLTATRLIRSELGLTDLPILALTASVLADKQQAAREAGMNGLLPKPLDLEQLVAEVRKWLPSPRPLAGEGAGVRAADFAAPPHPSPPPAGGREAVDDFPAIPGIDRARAAQTLGGDRAFFLRLLNGFVSEFADVVEQTHRDLAEDDREAAARRLHTLRGNAGNLGALDLMATAGELEEAIRRGETDLAAGLESLGRQLAALTAASAPWREAAVPSTPTPPLDAEQLEALRTALRQYDLKALRCFEALKPALLGALGEAKTGALDAAMHGLRFDEALDLLA